METTRLDHGNRRRRVNGRLRRHAFVAFAGLCLFAPAMMPSPGEGSLSVRPALIEMPLGGKERPSETITITNITDEVARYRLQIVHFLYDEGGGFRIVEPNERSMASWIKCNPREFELPPKATRAVRLTVVPPATLTAGEYWAAVWFEPLTGRVESAEDGQGRKMTLKVMTNIIVPIVGTVPGVTYTCRLDDLEASRIDGGISIVARLSNTGSGRMKLKGSYELLDAANTRVAEGLIGDDTILAGGKRAFKQTIPGDFAAGDYTVRVQYKSEKLSAVLAGQSRVP